MSIDGASPVHPTFLYESLWNFVGFLVLHFYSKKRKFKGEMALLYVAWYGLGRAWIEACGRTACISARCAYRSCWPA